MHQARHQTTWHIPAQVGSIWQEGRGHPRRTGFRPANQNNHGQVRRVLLPGSSWQNWQAEQDVQCSVGLVLPRLVHRRRDGYPWITQTLTRSTSDRCPVGADSWCFYRKALATGQKPGPHRVNVHTPLSTEVASHVKDIYTRLSHKSLLE